MRESRGKSLLPRTTLHSDSEQLVFFYTKRTGKDFVHNYCTFRGHENQIANSFFYMVSVHLGPGYCMKPLEI